MQVLVYLFVFLGSAFAGYLSKGNEALSPSTSIRGSQSIGSANYANTAENIAISQPQLLSKTSGTSLSNSASKTNFESSAPLKGLGRSGSLGSGVSVGSVGSSVSYGGAVRSTLPVVSSVSYSNIPLARPLPAYSYKSYSYPTYGSTFSALPVGRSYQSTTYGQSVGIAGASSNVLLNQQRPIGRTYLSYQSSGYPSSGLYVSNTPLVNTVPVLYPVGQLPVGQTYPLLSRGQSSTTLLSSSIPLTAGQTTTFTGNSGLLSQQPLQTTQQEFDNNRDEQQQTFVDTDPVVQQQNEVVQQEVAQQPEPIQQQQVEQVQIAPPAPLKTAPLLPQRPLQPAVLKN